MQIYHNFLRTFNSIFSDNEVEEAKKSGRRDKMALETVFHSKINATPEFRQFVATKLTGILDQSIKETKTKIVAEEDKKETENEGIKLFKNSKNVFIEKEKKEPEVPKIRPDLLAHRKHSLENTEDLKSVAVSSQWVLEQRGVYYKGPDESRSKVVTEL